MKTIIAAVALALVTCASANADTRTQTTTRCERDFMGAYVCRSVATSGTEQPDRAPVMTTQEQAEAEARDAEWVAYCRPRIEQGRDGIERYRYAKAGCEFGRSRD